MTLEWQGIIFGFLISLYEMPSLFDNTDCLPRPQPQPALFAKNSLKAGLADKAGLSQNEPMSAHSFVRLSFVRFETRQARQTRQAILIILVASRRPAGGNQYYQIGMASHKGK